MRLPPNALPRLRLPRSLRVQLLLATVPLAVLGAVVSAWAANGQTREALFDEQVRESSEPDLIHTVSKPSSRNRETGRGSTNSWSNSPRTMTVESSSGP